MKISTNVTVLYILLLYSCLVISCAGGKSHTSGRENIEIKYDWLLGAQAYTFKNFTFYETLKR